MKKHNRTITTIAAAAALFCSGCVTSGIKSTGNWFAAGFMDYGNVQDSQIDNSRDITANQNSSELSTQIEEGRKADAAQTEYVLSTCSPVINDRFVAEFSIDGQLYIGLANDNGQVLWAHAVDQYPDVAMQDGYITLIYYNDKAGSATELQDIGINQYQNLNKVEILDLDGKVTSTYNAEELDVDNVAFGGGYVVRKATYKDFDSNETFYEFYSPTKEPLGRLPEKDGHGQPHYLSNGVFMIVNYDIAPEGVLYLFTRGEQVVYKEGYKASVWGHENFSNGKFYAGFEERENSIAAVFYDEKGARSEAELSFAKFGEYIRDLEYRNGYLYFRSTDGNRYAKNTETGQESKLDEKLKDRFRSQVFLERPDGSVIINNFKGADELNYVLFTDAAYSPLAEMQCVGINGISEDNILYHDTGTLITYGVKPGTDLDHMSNDDYSLYIYDAALQPTVQLDKSFNVQKRFKGTLQNSILRNASEYTENTIYYDAHTGEAVIDPETELDFSKTEFHE